MRRIEEELGRRAPEGVSKMRIDALRKDLVGMSSLRQSAVTVATPARKPTEQLDESAKLTADAERQMLDLPAAEAEALAPVVINLDVRLARPGGSVTVNQQKKSVTRLADAFAEALLTDGGDIADDEIFQVSADDR